MRIEVCRADTLDYAPCQYGASKLVFRGPKKSTDKDYIAVLGGTEVYGRFIAHPFSDLVEDDIGMPCLNLGCQNAGIDAFLYDPDIMTLAKGARLTVLQVMGAQNMSNRFYRVHPRRNDRFLGPSPMLQSIFHEVDFTDFSFTRHMLSTLQMVSPDRFGILRDELRAAWSVRMRLLLQTIDGPVVMLWLPEETSHGLGKEPLFVGADMVRDVGERTRGVIEVPVRRAGDDLNGMIFAQMEASVAAQMLNAATHRTIADAMKAAVADAL